MFSNGNDAGDFAVGFDLGLLLLRLAIGLTMASHGAQKLFGWFGGDGLEGTGGFMESLGLRPGRLHAALSGLSECGGGLLLALGLLTPLGSVLIIAVMLVATMTAHRGKGFYNTSGGAEFPFVLAISALTIAFTGAGAFSLDAALGIDLQLAGWKIGIAAAILALVGAFGVLATRAPIRTHADV